MFKKNVTLGFRDDFSFWICFNLCYNIILGKVIFLIQLIKYLKKYTFLIIITLLLIFISVIADLYLPSLMSDIINYGVILGDSAYIYKLGIIMILVTLGAMICSILYTYFSSIISSGFGKILRSKIYTKVMEYSSYEFDKINTSSLIMRSTNDVNQVQNFVGMMLRILVIAPITCIGGIVMAYLQNKSLTLIFVVAIPILVGSVALIATKTVPYFEKFQQGMDKLNKILRERLDGIRVIRAFNKEKYEQKRYMKNNADLMNIGVRINNNMALLFPLINLIISFVTIAVIWFGSQKIEMGSMLIGDLMAFIQYATQIMYSFVTLTMTFVMIPRAIVSSNRICEVLNMRVFIKDDLRVKKLDKNIDPIVKFNHVSFKYPGSDEQVIKGVSFDIKKGETVAIVGGTGSGKTTLLNLMLRFYDITSGNILIHGKDIRDLSVREIRDVVSYAPQKALLFSGTIESNVKFAKKDATKEEVIEALKMAQAYDFVMNLDNKLHYEVAQGGSNLSGGQKQRISIARAIIKKASLYVFDDSFSALDYKTDSLLRKSLKEAMGSSAFLIVATRISTIMKADKIIVMDNGAIADIGRHEELLQRSSVYQEIVYSQLEEKEVKKDE